MHSANFVVDTTPDFEETHYRIRSIDFDQQSYEGRKNVYLPQYYKQNNDILKIGFEMLTYESVRQYQLEERTLIANRLRASRYLLRDIMGAMIPDQISPLDHVLHLREELAQHYQNVKFLRANSMGDILKESLKQLFR
jgi:hypothetical protein